MRALTLFLTTFCLLLVGNLFSQNYFSGELFEAYQWDKTYLNNIELKLEQSIVLRKRMLTKKEKTIGKKIKENKQFYDEVVISKGSKLEVVSIRDGVLEIMFDKNSGLTLLFGPDDNDNENYSVIVKEMKGEKGVTEYNGVPFRVLNGSRLIIGKLKKKKLPPARVGDLPSNWAGNGSGLIIDGSGYVITNYHVIKDADKIAINISSNPDQDLSAKVVVKDLKNDLAILKITDSGFEEMKEISYSLVSGVQDVGTEVFTLGYPLAINSMGSEVKFADGSISAKSGYKDDVSAYQISVPVQPGNSGGPLFDYDGNLVGLVSAKISGSAIDNVSYAIKASYIASVIESSKSTINVPSGKSSGDIKALIKQLDDYVVLIKVD